MRNFQKIAEGVDVFPIVHALQRQPELWNAHPIRTTHPGTAHSQVDDILVWFNDTSDPQAVANDREVIPFPAWERLPQLRPVIFDLMRHVGGVRLGRVIVTRLAPGREITPHVDGGAPATFFDRYQIALQSLPGCVFRAGGEQVQMKTGEAWWFDNQQEHAVVNNSADDRLALIVDIRTA